MQKVSAAALVDNIEHLFEFCIPDSATDSNIVGEALRIGYIKYPRMVSVNVLRVTPIPKKKK